VVAGGGIAGLAAAAVLAEGDVAVTLLEQHEQLGGRVRAWPVADGDGRTMSRGFHAFFRQYYNLRALLRRADPSLRALTAVPDYPLVSGAGARDSFARIPRTPPWNLATFVARSETFPLRALLDVDVATALELLDVEFPRTFSDYDGQSAADFLARLRFPDAARHLALEVFARSFFARPDEFGAGELISMFHAYFVGSAEGLLFDVPTDDYDTALWAPLRDHLERLGVDVRTGTRVDGVDRDGDGVLAATDSGDVSADAVVLATDPRTARSVIESTALGDGPWRERVAATRSAPPFAVWRLWLRDPVAAERLPFLGTAGFGPLDNISVLERFEHGAARWTREHGGSVVELHAYALDPSYDAATVQRQLRAALGSIYPETRDVGIVAEEWLVADDCPLIDTGPWAQRPGVGTPDPRVVLAGDWVRCNYPVALMERAATTGMLAANRLLSGWGRSGADVWTVPMRGRHRVAAPLRRLLARRGAVGAGLVATQA
jgi:isorenieratene synthase